ncbi:amidohydrolase family protein [Mucilaginibacter pedocola]|uniref:Amidohydrolase-related domain-containing protein n=1 Tax=Mucilaginibacter pedocola TaxID=1792845 RepID=A0A1S9PMS4_9SPHI|nr:amidohydrolase family protein [Mucilaginibacter pedocola]OOQ62237.1 hypothetical protein BC343_04120 [Mucilaginibacter pedocola]
MKRIIILLISLAFGEISLHAQTYTDHHIHLQDSETVQLGFRMLKAFKETPKHIDSLVLNADTVIKRLDGAKFQSAWILSNAYWFGSPMTPVEDEYTVVKRQNDWIAAEAKRYPTRLKAFMSINPLKPYALEEIKRCGESKRFAGLKMHFANSKVNLQNKADVAKLKQVFAAASQYHLMLLVHFRSAKKWSGTTNTTVLLNDLMPYAKNTKVIIAHMAGWGGYDRPTNAALKLIAQWLKQSPTHRKNLYLELSAVLEAKASKDDLPIAVLKKRISEIGTGNILFGTDYPLIDIKPYVSLLEQKLGKPLVQQVLNNPSPE